MQRRHFELLAEAIKEFRKFATPEERKTIEAFAQSLAVRFKQANGGFKPERFFKACGMEA
jgi:hypothetical protein